ncbi:MAG: hypothetical protein HYV32_02725 [Candidatus Kerfeldbacteria bacterium]|nr:hypothetical protein [Candidatus Kerfeldbacteria bacterium]
MKTSKITAIRGFVYEREYETERGESALVVEYICVGNVHIAHDLYAGHRQHRYRVEGKCDGKCRRTCNLPKDVDKLVQLFVTEGKKEAVTLDEEIPSEVQAAARRIPSTHGLVVFDITNHNHGGTIERYFAFPKGKQRIGHEEIIVGEKPTVFSYMDSEFDYEILLPKGSREFVKDDWIPRRYL